MITTRPDTTDTDYLRQMTQTPSAASAVSYSNVSSSIRSRSPGIVRPTALNPVSAMDFQPLPTKTGRCSKIRLNISLDSTRFVAGGKIYGRLELVCWSKKSLYLGEISVDLTGFEEITDRDYESTQSFLSSRIVFQGENLPPSAAVHGPNKDGFWKAKKGRTSFLFAFDLPHDCPSSFEFQKLARLKYVVNGVVQYKYHDRSDTLMKSKEAPVVEMRDPESVKSSTLHPVKVINERKLWFGGDGPVRLEAQIHQPIICSGSDVFVEVRVSNQSRRRVQGLKLSLLKRLLMVHPGPHKPNEDEIRIISEVSNEASFKSKDFIFDPNDDRTTLLHVQVPSEVYSVGNTTMAEVVCRVLVSLSMGTFSKDLTVEIPISVYHGSSILPPTIREEFYEENALGSPITTPPIPAFSPIGSASPTHRQYLKSLSTSPKRFLPWSDDEDLGGVDRLVATAAPVSPLRPPISDPSSKPLAPTMEAQPAAYINASERNKHLKSRPILEPASPSQVVYQHFLNSNVPQIYSENEAVSPGSPVTRLARPLPTVPDILPSNTQQHTEYEYYDYSPYEEERTKLPTSHVEAVARDEEVIKPRSNTLAFFYDRAAETSQQTLLSQNQETEMEDTIKQGATRPETLWGNPWADRSQKSVVLEGSNLSVSPKVAPGLMAYISRYSQAVAGSP